MSWKLTPTPPRWYALYWLAFQSAFWFLAWYLGPIVIARGIALSKGMQ